MSRIQYERTVGRNVPTEPTSAAHKAQPDQSQVAMAKQLATVYATLAPLTGGQVLTGKQILSNMCPSNEPVVDPNHPVNIDVPYDRPGPGAVNTQCRHFVAKGTVKFEVHNMDGIVAGQVLSIGYDGYDWSISKWPAWVA